MTDLSPEFKKGYRAGFSKAEKVLRLYIDEARKAGAASGAPKWAVDKAVAEMTDHAQKMLVLLGKIKDAEPQMWVED